MSGPLAWFGTAVYQDEIYVIGGAWFISGSETNEIRVYDPSADTWTSKTSMPTARWGAEANVVHEKIYVIGGATDGVLDVNEVYDPATDTWSTKTPIPTPVTSYASAVVDDKIYIIGGAAPEANSTSKQHINLIQIYDPEKDSWSSGTPMPNTQNAIAAGATTGIMAPRKIYVIGDGLNQVYNPSNDSWTIGEPIPNSANRLTNFDDAEVAVVNDQIYALGGVYESENGEIYSVNEQYTPIDYGASDLTTPSPSTEPQEPIQFPEVFVAASVAIFAIVGVGLLVYFKKRKH
jgi:N-acetylneuraminic acid mutarotase